MDFVWIILSALALAILLFFLWLFIKSRRAQHAHREREQTKEERGEEKGRIGENYIASLLRRCMHEGDTLLNNVILSNPYTKASFEIDHILLSRRGIFVVETKNRSGEIYGDDEAERWTQILGNGDVRHEFYSPVKQCIAHAEKVASVTHCEKTYPIVVFAQGNTKFIKSDIVFTPRQMCAHLDTCGNIVGERELNQALRFLQYYMSHSISAEEHARNVRKKYGE